MNRASRYVENFVVKCICAACCMLGSIAFAGGEAPSTGQCELISMEPMPGEDKSLVKLRCEDGEIREYTIDSEGPVAHGEDICKVYAYPWCPGQSARSPGEPVEA